MCWMDKNSLMDLFQHSTMVGSVRYTTSEFRLFLTHCISKEKVRVEDCKNLFFSSSSN